MSHADARLVKLERLVKGLDARLAVLEGAASPQPLPSLSDSPLRFKSVPLQSCLNMVPCLHTTAQDRLLAGCSSSVWTGRWAIDPQRESSRLRGEASDQKYITARDEACEPANAFMLSPVRSVRGKVTDAIEQHGNMRLRGLRGKMWLMFGTSVDHMLIRDICVDFNAEVHCTVAA